jgi:hypothetical protein
MYVTSIQEDRGEVTATVSQRVEGQRDEHRNRSYTFAVKDLKRLKANDQIRLNEDHYFFSAHNGPTLEVFPLPPQGAKK